MRRWVTAVVLVAATSCAGNTGGAQGDASAEPDSVPASAPSPSRQSSTTASVPEAPSPPTAVLPVPATPVHVFPVEPAGAASYSDGGHAYPATDVFAPEGTAFVAVTDGRVDALRTTDEWDPATDDPAERGGRFVAIVGDDGVRYYGSHLASVTPGLELGSLVKAGERLGSVGRSGNARDTPPHLHFGISEPTFPEDWEARRGQIAPKPFLDAWRTGDVAATPSVELIS